jgi:hypothetical protein
MLGSRKLALNSLICLILSLFGCQSGNTVNIQSAQQDLMDSPSLPTGAYLPESENAATVYLTDLDLIDLDRGADLSHLSGRIVQIRLFLRPSAGSTPVKNSACSATVRHVILANGNIGVYSGGAFLNPSGKVGDPRLSGSIQHATMRLTGSAGAFSDRLGAANLDAHFDVKKDEALAKRIGARLDDILLTVGEARRTGQANPTNP